MEASVTEEEKIKVSSLKIFLPNNTSCPKCIKLVLVTRNHHKSHFLKTEN